MVVEGEIFEEWDSGGREQGKSGYFMVPYTLGHGGIQDCQSKKMVQCSHDKQNTPRCHQLYAKRKTQQIAQTFDPIERAHAHTGVARHRMFNIQDARL